MKNKVISILLSIVFLMGVFPVYISAADITPIMPQAGDGSEEYPYVIESARELLWFARSVNGENYGGHAQHDACAVLAADIDLENIEWTPVGNVSSHSSESFYTGIFDGNGHTVSNLKVSSSLNRFFGGLFGGLDGNATIKNLGVVNAEITAFGGAGAIAGGTTLEENTVTITHCYAANVVLDAPGGNYNAGGFIGGMWGTKSECGISNSFAYNISISSDTMNRGYFVGYSAIVRNSYCYYNSAVNATETTGITATADEFSSGKIAYLLNGSVDHGSDWYQTLGGESSDLYPVLDSTHGKVFRVSDNKYASVICNDHVYDEGVFFEPTCTEYGYYKKTCTVCKAVYNDVDFSAQPLGHDWVSTAVPATCTEDGYFSFACSRCDATDTQPNPSDKAVGHHNFNSSGFCTVCDAPEPCVYLTKENVASYGLTTSYTEYYAISNAGNLYWFADFLTNNDNITKGILVNDITVNNNVLDENGDLSEGSFREWIPMRSGEKDFRGFFVGGGHAISGLVVSNDSQYNGLFAKLNDGSRVYDLVIRDSYFYGSSYVGAICGFNYRGDVRNCEVHATVKGVASTCGGICGSIDSYFRYSSNYGQLLNCSFYGKVTSTSSCAGISGEMGGVYGGEQDKCVAIKGCRNYADVIAESYAGGIFAINHNLRAVECINYGNIHAKYAGGLGGRMYNYSALERSFNNGAVSGTSGAGIVHTTYANSDLNNCYNAGVITADEACSFVSSMNIPTNDLFTVQNDLYCFNNNHDFPEYRFSFTSEQFASGEAAYIMNRYAGSDIWRQKLPDMLLPTTDTSMPIVYMYAPEGGEVYFSNVKCSHSYKNTHIAANCIECGKTLYECSVCGDSYISDIAGEPANGIHDFKNGYCSVCGVRDIPRLNSEGVYEISSAAQLTWFAGLVNGDEDVCDFDETANPDGIKQNESADAVLVSDISMAGVSGFAPIGIGESGYSGTFDGQGHSLCDFVFFVYGEIAAGGIFGTVKGCIKNVSVESAAVTSYAGYSGVLAGVLRDGAVIENCRVIDSSLDVSDPSGAGYIVGGAFAAEVRNSYSFGCSTTNGNIGGIVGQVFNEDYSVLSAGAAVNCYTDRSALIAQKLRTEPSEGEASVSEYRFASGEITYKLNGIQEDRNWYQNIKEETDILPVLNSSHSTVFRFNGGNVSYGNGNLCAHERFSSKTTEATCGLKGYTVDTCLDCGIEFIRDYTDVPEHNYVGNKCVNCGRYQPNIIADSAEAAELGLGDKYIGYAAIDCNDGIFWYADLINSYKNAKLNAVMTDDIVLNENLLDASFELDAEDPAVFEPIGSGENGYTGIFDGNSHTISGLYIRSSADNTGFIGYLDGGKIKDLNIEDSYIAGSDYTGGICGRMYAESSSVSDCTFSGNVNGGEYVGGIVGGINRYGDIDGCKTYGTVSGDTKVGGVAGGIYVSLISNCENNADVSAEGYYCGGIFAFASEGEVTCCINNGDVTGDSTVGGIGGWMYYTNTSLEHSCNTGDVKGSQFAGGVVGGVSGYASVNDCWSSGNVAAYSSRGGLAGNVGAADNMTNCSYDGTVFNGYWSGNIDVACKNCQAYSTDDFNSGRVAYEMNDNENAEIWYQDLSEENSYPSFDPELPSVYKYSFGADDERYCNSVDIDGDGDMDIDDYAAAVNIALGSEEYENEAAADVDGDGAVDVIDCSYIERIYCRIEERKF